MSDCIHDDEFRSVDEVREYYVKNGLTQQMAIEILEKKVRSFLYEHAEIKDPS